ncbi:MAG: hypothetical protein R3B09_01945 [Nannocystaceae bacterium]
MTGRRRSLRGAAAPLLDPLRRLWPSLRVLVVGYHLALIVVLSLPSADAMLHRPNWESANTKADLAHWAAALGRVGVEMTGPELADRLWRTAEALSGVQGAISRPFVDFSRIVGFRQGWAMFASPQRHPVELHVDLEEGGAWRPLSRPHDDAAAWRRATFEHNRYRKLAGSLGRRFQRRYYDPIARWLAREALADHPGATRVRVQLHAYTSLPPERVRVGERPRGVDREVRIFTAEELR